MTDGAGLLTKTDKCTDGLPNNHFPIKDAMTIAHPFTMLELVNNTM